MFRKSIILLFSILFYFATPLSAQLTVNATAVAASCSANGQVNVQVTGGSGDYTYQLAGSCSGNIPPQQEAIFDFLPPCEYTVTVLDRQTNETGGVKVEVEDQYDEIALAVMAEGCDQRLMVEGGRAPFRFYFSPNGVGGPYQLNDPADSPLFTGLSGSDIHLGVEDACGIWQVTPTPTALNPIQYVEFAQANEEGIGLNVMGGTEPFSFRVFNDADTLELTRSFITWDSLLCNAWLEVRDSCTSYLEPVYYEPRGKTICVNFSEGTAEVAPVAGVPPYKFTVITPDSVFRSDTGFFDSLPINTGSYEFYITDACGIERLFDVETRLRLDVAETELGCLDDELHLFPDRECGGLPFQPLQVTCLNCLPQDTVVASFLGEEIIWSGYGPGEWDILLENSCGDQTRCRDELIVELTPACDSIVARIVDLFSCDNGTNGRRVITGDDVTFFLKDENGTSLAGNNKTGVFENLSQGSYEVTAVLPNCDTLRNTTMISSSGMIDPYVESWVSYETEENGACQLFYYVDIETAQGPYILAGGAGNAYYEELNDFGERNCSFYNVRLSPGNYTLTSISACGERVLELPDPDYDFSVSLVDNCPGDAKLLANGIRTYEEWDTFFIPYQLNVQNLFPGYFVEAETGGSRAETDYTFRGLDAGLHTVYLFPLTENACAVDTIDILVPEYEDVAIEIAGDVVCDDEAITDLNIKLTGGQAPYDLRKLDCDAGSTFASFEVDSAEVFVDENLPLGGYCYAVSDVCFISADFQVKVRLFGDSIRIGYTCDGMLNLSVDSLPVDYTWLDTQGEIIGSQHLLSVPVSNQTETYTVQVALPECVVERSITVPSREIIPSIEITHNRMIPVICEGENISLTALTSDEHQVNWHTGDTVRVITVTEPDTYIATAINDIGCTNSDTLEVTRVPLPDPEIIGVLGFCLNESTTLSLDQNYVEQQWSTGEQTEQIAVATPMPVSVIVTDENGCIGQDSVDIVEWPLPEPVVQADSLICPGVTTEAGLTIAFAGYAWSDGTLLPVANLPAGTHSVTVTDNNGCRERDEVVIEEKPQLFAHLSGDTIICAGDSAFLSLAFTQPWYHTEFQILGTAGENIMLQSFGDTAFWLPVQNTTTLSLADIFMADYGCPVIPQGMPKIEANQLNLVFREGPISCYGGSDGTLEVFAASDFPPYNFFWENGSEEALLIDLPEGTYRVSARDQLGCMVMDSFLMQAPQLIRPNLQTLTPLCRDINDGLISLDGVTGGTPPFIWWLNGVDQNFVPGEVSGLLPDTYLIAIQDRNACLWDTTVVFPIPPPLALDAGPDQTITIGETAILNPATDVASLVYWQWEASQVLELDSSLIQQVIPFEKTDFTITVRNDYGCELIDRVSVFVNKDNQFEAPNAFSPNGDGRNDFFLLFGKESNVEKIELFEIYDRWGNKVFESRNMELNNEPTGWDGRLNGQLLSVGVYVWMAKVKRIDGEEAIVYGDVALVR